MGLHVLRVGRNEQTALLKCHTNLPLYPYFRHPLQNWERLVVLKFYQSYMGGGGISQMCKLGFPLSLWSWTSPMLVPFVILWIAHPLGSHLKVHTKDQPQVWDSSPSLGGNTQGFCCCWVPWFNQRIPLRRFSDTPPHPPQLGEELKSMHSLSSESEKGSRSVVSDSLWPHGL